MSATGGTSVGGVPRSTRRGATPAERAAAAKRESKSVDFKEQFGPESAGEWCELVKDFAALANSGGGILIVGLCDNGMPSCADVQPVLDLDPAAITDKLFRYTGEHYSGFAIHEARRDGAKLAVIAVEAVEVPIVFTKPGTYAIAGGKQKTAFSQGTIYVRHGAKSEPATSTDLRALIEARLEAAREAWLVNVRKVVEAPADAQVAVYRSVSSDASGGPTRIQLTTDPNAPVFGRLEPDQSHPYRQKELIREVNRRLPGKTSINAYDLRCARSAHAIDEKTAPEFCHSPKFGSMQYSDAFVDWLVEQYRRDKAFFTQARKRHYESMHPS